MPHSLLICFSLKEIPVALILFVLATRPTACLYLAKLGILYTVLLRRLNLFLQHPLFHIWGSCESFTVNQWHPTPVLLPGKSLDRGAWWAAVHGVAKSRTRLNNFIFTFHFHALEKEMATHSSVLAWRIPGTGEPGGLPSKGSHRVGHD